MYALNDYEYTYIDDIMYEKFKGSNRVNPFKKSYFLTKKEFQNKLASKEWADFVEGLKAEVALAKKRKLENKRQILINDIMSYQNQDSIFKDDYETLDKASLSYLQKALRKIKKKGAIKKRKFKRRSIVELKKSSRQYSDGLLLVDYIRADTLRLVLELKPSKLNVKYLEPIVCSEMTGREVLNTIIEVIGKQSPMMQRHFKHIVDRAKMRIDKNQIQ